MGALGVKGAKRVGKNKYQLTVYDGNDGSGNYQRHYATVDAKNKHELERARADFIYQIKNGLVGDHGSMLFRDLVDDWYKNHMYDKSPNTWRGYESNLRLRVLPAFAAMQIGKIEKYHIRQFFDKLKQPACEFNSIVPNPNVKQSTGDYFTATDKDEYIIKRKKYTLSAKTIDNHKILMNSIFSYAVYKEYIKESPMKGIKTPPLKRNRLAIYEKEDLLAMFEALQKMPLLWQAIILFAIGTGAREGEIAALETKHVDLNSGYVLITQSAATATGKGVIIKSTKNGHERGNYLPDEVLYAMRAYNTEREADKKKAGDSWVTEWKGKACDFFFTPDNGFGKPFRPSSIGQWWRRALKTYGLKHIRFHDLRHTSVALSIDAGEELEDIKERVGHASISTTSNDYGYLFQERKSRSADLLNRELKEIRKGRAKK